MEEWKKERQVGIPASHDLCARGFARGSIFNYLIISFCTNFIGYFGKNFSEKLKNSQTKDKILLISSG
jgi:hypothetical protein